MTTSGVSDLIRELFMTTFWLSLPALAAGFAIGVLVSLAQILTSIQDTSFSTVPRLAVFGATLMLAMPWMVVELIGYTTALLGDLGKFAR